MNISSLTTEQITNTIITILNDYLHPKTPLIQDESLFSENYRLSFPELQHIIPAEYHRIFSSSDWFNTESGEIEATDKNGCQSAYIITLLSNEDHSKAYLLYIQPLDCERSDEISIVKDFLKYR